MKHLKRFIVLAMVLGIGGILLMRVPATQFRGQDSQELTRHYNLIKAKDINSRTISLYSDDRKVETSGNDQIWMSDDMTLMIPETMVNDLFQCIAARMDGDIIKLIKGQKTCEIDIQKNRVRTDDGWTEARIAEFDRHGNICLSANYLADYFDYDYQKSNAGTLCNCNTADSWFWYVSCYDSRTQTLAAGAPEKFKYQRLCT